METGIDASEFNQSDRIGLFLASMCVRSRGGRFSRRIRIGYDLVFGGSTPTPAILMLIVHPSRLEDLPEPHRIVFGAAELDCSTNKHLLNNQADKSCAMAEGSLWTEGE